MIEKIITKDKIQWISGGAVILALTAFLAVDFSLKASERLLKAQLEHTRRTLAMVNNVMAIKDDAPLRSRMISTKEADVVTQELMALAKADKIDVLGFDPMTISKNESGFVTVFPLTIEISGSYASLGHLMGKLRNLSRGFVVVRSFVIDRQDAAGQRLHARLSLEVLLHDAE